VSAVRVRAEGDTAIVSFERPLLTRTTLEAATEAIARTGSEHRAVVIASDHPRIFLAGAHLGEIAGLDQLSSDTYSRLGRRLMKTVATLPIPVVAAVHGACTGGGLDLVMACDWISAEGDARFGHPGVRRGLITGWSGTALLRRRLGVRSAIALLAAGAMLSADTAFGAGLVDELANEAVPTALRRADVLARLSPRRLEAWRAARSGGFVDIFGVNVVHTKR
jgi:enoyl-CoA hydratase